jgi:hypothetical protein
VRGRIAQLQLELAGHDLASTPTEADRKALHATLVERVRTGSAPVRKAMFSALV